MGEAPKTIEQLIQDLHQGDFMSRSNAARDLGKSRDPRAMEALLPDVNDKDWRVRRNAVQALGALKAKAAVEPLLQALNDRTMTVRMRAAVALGRIKDPRAIPGLVAALRDREGDVVRSAVQSLKKFGKAALPALEAALPAADIPMRLDLLTVMADIPGTDIVQDLRAIAADPNTMVRAQVLRLLAKTGKLSALETIQEHLADPHPYVQMIAIEALGRFKDSQVGDILLSRLSDHELYGQNREMYRAITGTMQKIAGLPPEFAGPLTNQPAALAGLLNDDQRMGLNLLMSQYTVMLKEMVGLENAAPDAPLPAAYKKLMAMFDQVRGAGNAATRQVDDLMELLSHSRPLTRAAAALSLVWYMDPRALEPLAVARMDPNPQVHVAADWAYETLLRTLLYRDQLGNEGN